MEPKLKDVKVGDRFIRVLGGKVKMEVVVSRVKGQIIEVTVPDAMKALHIKKLKEMSELYKIPIEETQIEESGLHWNFSSTTAGEIDIALGWDGIYTGSILIKSE